MDSSQMDSRSHAFESHAETALLSAGVPLPCPHPMPVQPLTAWTLATVVGAVLMAVLAVPRALVLAPAVIGRSRRA